MQGAAPNGREVLDQSRELPTSCISFLRQWWQTTTHTGSEQQKPVLSQAGDQPSVVRVPQCCAPSRGFSTASFLLLLVFWALGIPGLVAPSLPSLAPSTPGFSSVSVSLRRVLSMI